jgi:hypothetical protein
VKNSTSLNLENSSATLIPARALVILVLGLLASWLAAGSLGWVAPLLQKSLAWLIFAIICSAALSGGRRFSASDLALLGGSCLLAVLMTASRLPPVNILAVAILLAAIAHLRPGPIARVANSTAIAASSLAVFHLICDGSAAAWTLTDSVGCAEGFLAGWLTGHKLLIGASFGGIDFLILMIALTAAWLVAAPPPRVVRAVWAGLFILLAQFAYLTILACSDDLAALLPPEVAPKFVGASHLGIWTWGNAIRALLPWNLPLLAAIFHSAVAVGMFRLTTWPATTEDLPAEKDPASAEIGPAASEGRRRNRSLQSGLAGPVQPMHVNWLRFAPGGLLIVAAVLLTYTPGRPDLQKRRIVAYDDGSTDWSTADTGSVPPGSIPRYGLLPALVASLGGEFIRSRELTDADLQAADVLVVLPPRGAANSAPPGMPEELRNRIWRYVEGGGRLIVAGDPETSLGIIANSLNPLLTPTAMSFRDDTANSLTERWQDNLFSAPHAAMASGHPGHGDASFDRAASIRVAWPAGPLVVGRWAWDELGTDPDRAGALPYEPGNQLGDLVLAAQQNVGQGTVVTLSAASCLSNDGIPFSFGFTAPLLSALAAKDSTPLSWWRQVLGVLAACAAVVLFFRSAHGDPSIVIAVAAAALALALPACNWMSDVSGQIRPSGPKTSPQPVIYVDGSHLEGMGKDPWGEDGVGRLMRILAGNGYLPLMAPDVSLDRLKQAAMLISIAPGKSFSGDEIAAVKQFVSGGGVFLSMVGSPDAEPSRPLLEELNLKIWPMPVPPWVRATETTPVGNYFFPDREHTQVEFYAAWPVSGSPGGVLWPEDSSDPDKRSVLAANRIGGGQAVLIGDSAFALKKHLDADSPNPDYWKMQLKSWLGHEAPNPPAGPPNIVAPHAGPSNTGAVPGLPLPKAGKGATP